MTHKDAGKYAAKHTGMNLDERIASRIKEEIAGKAISCAEAHKIAEDLGVAPREVGIAIDLLEMKISKCQLGLFGYGEKKKLVKKADEVKLEIRQSIEAALGNGRLSCTDAWDLAEKYGLPRIKFAGITEKMGIKISSCQLGAFK